jgi:hypothetical protein
MKNVQDELAGIRLIKEKLVRERDETVLKSHQLTADLRVLLYFGFKCEQNQEGSSGNSYLTVLIILEGYAYVHYN